ncbi:MAG: hypothetical protein ABSC92_15050 [Rhizomicrobium sp.]
MWMGLIHHATIALIIAFFILFAASKAEGLVKALGTVLGLWVLALTILMVVGAVTAPMFGGKPFGMDWHGMHDHWMHHDGDHGGMGMAPPPAAVPAPVQPAAPAAGKH